MLILNDVTFLDFFDFLKNKAYFYFKNFVFFFYRVSKDHIFDKIGLINDLASLGLFKKRLSII